MRPRSGPLGRDVMLASVKGVWFRREVLSLAFYHKSPQGHEPAPRSVVSKFKSRPAEKHGVMGGERLQLGHEGPRLPSRTRLANWASLHTGARPHRDQCGGTSSCGRRLSIRRKKPRHANVLRSDAPRAKAWRRRGGSPDGFRQGPSPNNPVPLAEAPSCLSPQIRPPRSRGNRELH